MSTSDSSGRIRAEFVRLDENMDAAEDPIIMDYPYPFVDKTSTGRTVEHEPIGRPTVVQYMGPQSLEVTIEGHCYKDEADYLDRIREDGLVRVRTDRWSGIGLVESISTAASGEGGGPRGGTSNRIYEYVLTVLSVETTPPDSVRG